MFCVSHPGLTFSFLFVSPNLQSTWHFLSTTALCSGTVSVYALQLRLAAQKKKKKKSLQPRIPSLIYFLLLG